MRGLRVEEPPDVPVPDHAGSELAEDGPEEREEERAEEDLDLLAGSFASSGSSARVQGADGEGGGRTGEECESARSEESLGMGDEVAEYTYGDGNVSFMRRM